VATVVGVYAIKQRFGTAALVGVLGMRAAERSPDRFTRELAKRLSKEDPDERIRT